MTQPAQPDWEEIRRLVETTAEPIPAIAARFRLHHFVIYGRKRREHWHDPRRLDGIVPATARAASTAEISGAATALQPEQTGKSAQDTREAHPIAEAVASSPRAIDQPTDHPAAAPALRRIQPTVLGNPNRLRSIVKRIMATVVRRLDILEEQLARPKPISPQDGERIDRAIRFIMMNFEKARAIYAQLELEQRSSKRSTLTLEAQRRALAERIERLNQEWLARRSGGQAQPAGDEATRADLAGEVDQGRPEQPNPAGPG